MAESAIVQIILGVEERFGIYRPAYRAVADARFHFRRCGMDVPFGRDRPQNSMIVIEHGEVGDVGTYEAAGAADDGLQKILQRQGSGKIVRRIDKEPETAFTDAAVADRLSDGLEVCM
ncbi:MAG: hypothetical protein WA851_01405 [Xanthobacteraceae bacterium]